MGYIINVLLGIVATYAVRLIDRIVKRKAKKKRAPQTKVKP